MSEPKRTIYMIMAVVGGVILFFVFCVYALIFITESKTNRLKDVANQKSQTLSEIRFLDNQKTIAEPVVQGDFLTANEDERLSTDAIANFVLEGTLKEVRSEVKENLKNQGFTPAESIGRLNNGQVHNIGSDPTIIELYSNSRDVLVIYYELKDDIDCPENPICDAIDESKSTGNDRTYVFDELLISSFGVNLENRYALEY